MILRLTKAFLHLIALTLVLPLALPERVLRLLFGRDVLFVAHSQFLSLFPGKIGSYIRNSYYHLTLKSCPLDCCFSFGMVFTHSDVSVGHRIYVGSYSRIGLAEIGDDSMISDNVHIISGAHQHGISDAQNFQDQPQRFERVHLGVNVWVGANCVIMSDIGSGSVIGAGSVVTKPIANQSVAAGVPARIIRERHAAQA